MCSSSTRHSSVFARSRGACAVAGTVAPVGPRKPENGHKVNEKRIRRLMRLTGLMPIHQKPNTSQPRKGHKTYPYLLGGLRVERPGQVWCADIT